MSDLRDVLPAWGVPAPWTIQSSEGGTNNRSFVVGTPSGSYVLRMYQNVGDPARIRYEHALLLRLQDAGLSFAVPRPIETSAGETYVVADGVAAAVFPIIEGIPPQAGSAAHARVCGEALGELDAALAEIEAPPVPTGLLRFGDLCERTPLVDEALSLLAQMADDVGRRARFEEILARVSGVRAGLPEQVIHGDFFRGNVLMSRNRVSGILDFEFAGPGLRAMDLAVAVRGFASGEWGTSTNWRLVEALAGGYGRRVALSAAEVGALPALIVLREAMSLVHWAGRYRQGLTSRDDLRQRARDLLHLDERLRVHGAELGRRVERSTLIWRGDRLSGSPPPSPPRAEERRGQQM